MIALTDDKGRLVRVSAVRPGRTSEITACRHNKLTTQLRAAGLGAIADLGFVGLDDSGPNADPAVITGYKSARNRALTRGQKLSNKALAAVRAPVEHGARACCISAWLRRCAVGAGGQAAIGRRLSARAAGGSTRCCMGRGQPAARAAPVCHLSRANAALHSRHRPSPPSDDHRQDPGQQDALGSPGLPAPSPTRRCLAAPIPGATHWSGR